MTDLVENYNNKVIIRNKWNIWLDYDLTNKSVSNINIMGATHNSAKQIFIIVNWVVVSEILQQCDPAEFIILIIYNYL